MKNTIAKKPSDKLIEMGYSNSGNTHFKGVDMDKLFNIRRDYFLDNLFVSDDYRKFFDEDNEISIYVITGLDCTLICLGSRDWDMPNRMAADHDGEVVLSNGNDEPFFSPVANINSASWEHHDDESFTAGFIDISSLGYYEINGSHYHWSSCLCIPKVTKYNPGEETVKMIIKKLKL
mgnify:CR=1 FL=1